MIAVLASSLQAGDRVTYRDVTVVIVRVNERYVDLFGRVLSSHWGRREDTGQEGRMPFGPKGVFDKVEA